MRSVWLLFALCGLAHAQPTGELQQELQAGIDAFRLGKLEDARMHLQRARALDRKVGEVHRYLAAVAQAEKEWDDCVISAREALIVEPAKETADTRKLHEACRVGGGRPPYIGEDPLGEFAAIAVTSNVNPATVKVRGLVLGGTPITPRVVTAGRLAIDVERGGYLTSRLDIDALPGIVTDVRVELQVGEEPVTGPVARKSGRLVFDRRPGMLIVDGMPAKVPEDNRVPLSPGIHLIEIREPGKDAWRRRVAITADQDHRVTPQLVDAEPRERRRTIALAVGGAAAVLLGLGAGAFYRSSGASEDAREILAAEIARPVGDETPPIRTRADFEDARARANKWATISNVSYGAGLAALGVGIYLYVTSRAPADDDAPDLVIAPIEGGALIGRSGSW